MEHENLADPYISPFGVLRNIYGVTSNDVLSRIERRTAAMHEAQIIRDGHDGDFDIDLIFEIHRKLFGEIYDWAGKGRTITLSKGWHEGSSGVTTFANPEQIIPRLKRLAATLPKRDKLESFDRTKLVSTMTSAFAELNDIHPFREGNGRTQRVFLRLMAMAAGHEMAWGVVTKERMIECSIASSQGDPRPIARLFREITDPTRVAALQKAVNFLQNNLPEWNDRYIATTTAGERYAGVLSGISGSDFLMRVEDLNRGWIAVGHTDDLPDDDMSSGADLDFTARNFKP